jgi:hypothetical protein
MKRLWNSYSKKMPDILVIRNDKLGDFMLAWPAFSLIKQQYPDARITALVPAYTQPMAELCPWIDDVIIDDQRAQTPYTCHARYASTASMPPYPCSRNYALRLPYGWRVYPFVSARLPSWHRRF